MRGVLILVACLMLGLPSMASAQCVGGKCYQPTTVSIEGIMLAPGETLLAIDGVPVVQSRPGPVARVVGAAVRPVATAVRAVGNALIVNRDERAYRHALREAQILAARRTAGHPLGVAPGARYSGTGISLSANRPNHCYAERFPDSRLIARAMVAGSDGRFYWSAHYR